MSVENELQDVEKDLRNDARDVEEKASKVGDAVKADAEKVGEEVKADVESIEHDLTRGAPREQASVQKDDEDREPTQAGDPNTAGRDVFRATDHTREAAYAMALKAESDAKRDLYVLRYRAANGRVDLDDEVAAVQKRLSDAVDELRSMEADREVPTSLNDRNP